MKEIIFEKVVLYLDNISQKQNFKFIKNILGEEISVIFDVGCHKGETIDLIQKYFKVEKIFAFEPNEALINKIDKSKYLNTKFIKKALGEKSDQCIVEKFPAFAIGIFATSERATTLSLEYARLAAGSIATALA